MLLWLDASDASTLFQDAGLTIAAANGDPVGGWADKSGNGYNAVQSNTAAQPVRNDTGMNGQPTLSFSGADADGMAISDSLSLARPYTVFIVNQYTGDIRGRTLQGQDANWLHGLWAGNISSYADGFVGGNPVADANFVYVADTTGTPTGDSSLFVNGLDLTVNPAPTGQPGRLGLMSGGQFPAEVSDADVSEIVIYNRVLTADELTQNRDYLYTKYNTTMLLPPNPTNTVLKGTVGTFASAADLDMDGQFAYAVNVGGPGNLVVGNATFTDGSEAGMAGGSSPGVTITDANEIPDWHPAANYGDTPGDDALETVMTSIRWNVPPGVNVDMAVEPGQQYKLQLLFAESCCDRGFDIFVEGEMSVDNFNVQFTQGGINNGEQGVVFTQLVSSDDGVLSVQLGGSNSLAPDNNPILNGFTLEVVPEPSSFALVILGLVPLLGRRRGR
jgi:hypothetical protein